MKETVRIVDVKTGAAIGTIAVASTGSGEMVSTRTVRIPTLTQVRAELGSGAKGTALTP
jgi:hypothetical protein